MFNGKTDLFSFGCGIEDKEDNSFILTGGNIDNEPSTSMNRVTKYYRNGDFQDLPNLNKERAQHGCASYKNSQNQKVNHIQNHGSSNIYL